jgi:hypothetical protein
MEDTKPIYPVIVGDKLRKFLVKNRAYKKFIKNCQNPESWFQQNETPDSCHRKYVEESHEDAIMLAFRWTETPEDWDYWNKLNEKLWRTNQNSK